MSYSTWIVFFLLLLIVLGQHKELIRRVSMIRRKRKLKGRSRRGFMNELVKNYIGKECIIYSAGSTTITGFIEEINENWISIKTNDGLEILNLDYVNRIKEYPLNKKGKKKLIVG